MKKNKNISAVLLVTVASLVFAGCGSGESEPEQVAAEPQAAPAPESAGLTVDASSFGCLAEMTSVRHFFVDNLLGDLESTIAIAESTEGGTYPVGSIVQLVPDEAMVKHPSGYNAATKDWEFFELDLTPEGQTIRARGFVDVVNRFGGNCFGCHVKAEARFDMICERDHGCDDIPVTREEIAALQAADPRCQ